MKNFKKIYLFFFTGLFSFIVFVFIDIYYHTDVYEKVILSSAVSVSFFFMILGIYFYDFSRLKFIRIIAYYSYSWYLWHVTFVTYLTNKLGTTILGLLVYLILSFTCAMISTIFIEENFLEKRKLVIDKLFNKTNGKGINI